MNTTTSRLFFHQNQILNHLIKGADRILVCWYAAHLLSHHLGWDTLFIFFPFLMFLNSLISYICLLYVWLTYFPLFMFWCMHHLIIIIMTIIILGQLLWFDIQQGTFLGLYEKCYQRSFPGFNCLQCICIFTFTCLHFHQSFIIAS